MKRYAIIETWNGCGYSDENRLNSIQEFISPAEAKEFCRQAIIDSQDIDDVDDENEFYPLENGYGWTILDDCEDSGTYQFFEITDDLYGVVVRCNINEAIPCNKAQFDDLKSIAVAQAYREDYDEGELDDDNVFIGAHKGEYDYQFIKL